MDDEYYGYYKNAHKTKDSMKELIKIQGERLRRLNKDYKEMYQELKKTYKEMIHYRNEDRLKNKRINKAIKYIEEYYKKNNFYESIENCMTFCEFDKNDLLNILKGDNNGD